MKLYRGVVILLGCALTFMTSNADDFVNDYDQPAFFQCPTGQTMSYIYSIHSDYYEDRRWQFRCQVVKSKTTKNCQESGYVNEYDQVLTFQCPGNKVITGMNSVHDNYYEDRRFSFQCCDVAEQIPGDCVLTTDVNEYDKPLRLTVDSGFVIKGATSIHSNYYEDRKWRFTICKLI